jgi:hypothetical protein
MQKGRETGLERSFSSNPDLVADEAEPVPETLISSILRKSGKELMDCGFY